MAKIWDGPTPPIISGSIGPLMDIGFAMGFRAAKNDDMALYLAMKSMRLVDLMGTPGAQEALAAYEAGLREDA